MATPAVTPTPTPAATPTTPTSFLYDNARKLFLTGGWDIVIDPMWAMLVQPSYAANPAHAARADVVANEYVGTGYTAGGQLLTGVNITLDTTNHVAAVHANPVAWPNSTTGVGYMVIYKKGATDATSPLLSCLSLAGMSATYQITFDPTYGIVSF